MVEVCEECDEKHICHDYKEGFRAKIVDDCEDYRPALPRDNPLEALKQAAQLFDAIFEYGPLDVQQKDDFHDLIAIAEDKLKEVEK